MDLPDLSARELQRYSRHLLLPEVGEEGQRRLKHARVLCVGAGGLGSPAALYLAAAGVGTLGIVDFDVVDFSNLQRQIIHGTADVGMPKTSSARARIEAMNPEVRVETFDAPFSVDNARSLVEAFDVIVDGTDNFPARYLVNDACVLFGRPNAWGSIFRFEGQASVFAAPGGPCYRCLHPEPPPPDLVPSCAEAGVLGVLPGVIGTIQATEAIKLILGIGDPLVGRFLVYDALKMRFRELRLPKDPDCPICGANPSITTLQESGAFCARNGDSPRFADTGNGDSPRFADTGNGDSPRFADTGNGDSPRFADTRNGDSPRFGMTVRELKARMDAGTTPVIVDVRESGRGRDLPAAGQPPHPPRRASRTAW